MTNALSENPLWEYSISVYQNAEVASTCLELQDRFQFDVNFLLFAGWLSEDGVLLTPTHLQALHREVSEWRDGVVQPLRALRRQLAGEKSAAAIREQIKHIELVAERRQQDLMYRCWQTLEFLPASSSGPRDNLQVVADFFAVESEPCQPCLARLEKLLLT
jgi:uncharacterized protein (TIGR02444 family)